MVHHSFSKQSWLVALWEALGGLHRAGKVVDWGLRGGKRALMSQGGLLAWGINTVSWFAHPVNTNNLTFLAALAFCFLSDCGHSFFSLYSYLSFIGRGKRNNFMETGSVKRRVSSCWAVAAVAATAASLSAFNNSICCP